MCYIEYIKYRKTNEVIKTTDERGLVKNKENKNKRESDHERGRGREGRGGRGENEFKN